MKKINTTLDISAMVTCQKCNEYFDLFQIDSLTDDGLIYEAALGKNGFGVEDWDTEIECPVCSAEMTICNIDY